MRWVVSLLLICALLGCASRSLTCPSVLPRTGATFTDARLEYAQLRNDHNGAVRDWERAKVSGRTSLLSLESSLIIAETFRVDLERELDDWTRYGAEPANWRHANAMYRRSLEVALAKAQGTYPRMFREAP